MKTITIIPAAWTPYLQSVLRIVAGLLLLEHGTGKLLGFPAAARRSTDDAATACSLFTGAIELVGGALIVVGFLTRPAAFVLSGFMAVGLFHGPFPDGLLPRAQPRRAGDPLLLRLPLFRRRRPRPVGDRQGLTR